MPEPTKAKEARNSSRQEVPWNGKWLLMATVVSKPVTSLHVSHLIQTVPQGNLCSLRPQNSFIRQCITQYHILQAVYILFTSMKCLRRCRRARRWKKTRDSEAEESYFCMHIPIGSHQSVRPALRRTRQERRAAAEGGARVRQQSRLQVIRCNSACSLFLHSCS